MESMTQTEKNGVYMSNCIYWIKQYENGNCELQRAKSAARHLVQYLDEPHTLPTPTPPKPGGKTERGLR